MQFLALFVATLVSAAVAAPADQDWQQNQPGKPDQCGQPGKPGNWTNDNDGHNGQWGEKVRVGYTLDLNYNTPLGSLSCSSVFDKKYPRMSRLLHICTRIHLTSLLCLQNSRASRSASCPHHLSSLRSLVLVGFLP